MLETSSRLAYSSVVESLLATQEALWSMILTRGRGFKTVFIFIDLIDQTQDLTHTRHTLYHRATYPDLLVYSETLSLAFSSFSPDSDFQVAGISGSCCFIGNLSAFLMIPSKSINLKIRVSA